MAVEELLDSGSTDTEEEKAYLRLHVGGNSSVAGIVAGTES